MQRSPLLSAVAAALVLALPAAAQTPAAGVDLVLSTAGVQHGVPCSTFSQVPYFPWVTPGETWLFRVHSEPLTTHFVLVGPPPTSASSISGVENLLLIHAPVSILLNGVTGAADATSFCGRATPTTCCRSRSDRTPAPISRYSSSGSPRPPATGPSRATIG